MATETEPTVEIEISLLSDLPGWGETKMELLDKARRDIEKASILLVQIRDELSYDAGCLESMAATLLKRAKERVDMCHNDLDIEREDAELASKVGAS